MNERVVLTAIGEDRPGLVEEVSEFVFSCGGSIEDSRMANMHGQFAIVMLVGGAPETLERIAAGVDALGSRTGVHARLTAPAAAEPAPAAPYRLTGSALDQPGLVHQVAQVLREFGVNIETMETALEAAPVTGAPTFAMELTLAVPRGADVDALRAELARACDALNVDWQLTPL